MNEIAKMNAPFIQKIRLDGFLSFAPGTEPLELRPLNVLIGANGSGKSNLIEAFELLRAMPADFADAIRDGGGPAEWIWKGHDRVRNAEIEVEVRLAGIDRLLRHRLAFTSVQHRVEVVEESDRGGEAKAGKNGRILLLSAWKEQPGRECAINA
jgi:predicted ATPase